MASINCLNETQLHTCTDFDVDYIPALMLLEGDMVYEYYLNPKTTEAMAEFVFNGTNKDVAPDRQHKIADKYAAPRTWKRYVWFHFAKTMGTIDRFLYGIGFAFAYVLVPFPYHYLVIIFTCFVLYWIFKGIFLCIRWVCRRTCCRLLGKKPDQKKSNVSNEGKKDKCD